MLHTYTRIFMHACMHAHMLTLRYARLHKHVHGCACVHSLTHPLTWSQWKDKVSVPGGPKHGSRGDRFLGNSGVSLRDIYTPAEPSLTHARPGSVTACGGIKATEASEWF